MELTIKHMRLNGRREKDKVCIPSSLYMLIDSGATKVNRKNFGGEKNVKNLDHHRLSKNA